MQRVLALCISIILTGIIAACAPAPTPTAMPVPPSATPIPPTATSAAPTLTPTGSPARTAAPTAGPGTGWNFDGDPAGGLPKGAEVFEGQWTVRAEADAPSQPNALCQVGTAIYPALKLTDTIYKDVVVSTRFKPISGQQDQAAGIILRVQDRDNFYIVRANALENNVTFFLYRKGQRSTLNQAKADVLSGVWQELRVEASGNALRAFLNGRLVNEITDDTFREGKIGLWTKADSVTCFDDVRVTPR